MQDSTMTTFTPLFYFHLLNESAATYSNQIVLVGGRGIKIESFENIYPAITVSQSESSDITISTYINHGGIISWTT